MPANNSENLVKIVGRNQTVYTNPKNRDIVTGWELTVEYLPNEETFRVNVPDLKKETVRKAILEVISDLQGLDELEL